MSAIGAGQKVSNSTTPEPANASVIGVKTETIQKATLTANMSKEHHVYKKDGSLAGVHSIDIEKCKKLYGYWEGVDAIVQAYTMLHPQEMRQTVLENGAIRENQYDKFGAGQSKGFRHGLSLPPGLFHALREYDPELLKEKKKLNQFMKNYNGLRVCKEV